MPNSKTWGTAIKTNNESRFQTYTHLISCHHVPFISIYTHWTCAHWMVIIYWLDGHNVLDIMSLYIYIQIYTQSYPMKPWDMYIIDITSRAFFPTQPLEKVEFSKTWMERLGKCWEENRWKQHLEKNDCEEAFYLFGDYFPFLFHLLSQLELQFFGSPISHFQTYETWWAILNIIQHHPSV